MNKLKFQIQQLDSALSSNNVYINQQLKILKKHRDTPKYIYIAILGSFLYGYLLSRNKNSKELLVALIILSLKMNRVSKNIKLLLPFVS